MVSEIEARLALTNDFPKLKGSNFSVTSEPDRIYNCIAWAAEDSTSWWEPSKYGYWPDACPRSYSLAAYKRAFATLGYREAPFEDNAIEFEFVAIYAADGVPKHAARQLTDGNWTSKLGASHDICHNLSGLNGSQYGEPVVFMKRPRISGKAAA